ncbi:hypothetical protein [Psychromonas algarum]|nr:hypothetical protein [Psychromonas sp. RZ22]
METMNSTMTLFGSKSSSVDEAENCIDDNGVEADDYVQATFYYLSHTH